MNNYICRQCKKEVGLLHMCIPVGNRPVVVQFVSKYQPIRREYLKRFGSRSVAKMEAIKRREVKRGWIVYA